MKKFTFLILSLFLIVIGCKKDDITTTVTDTSEQDSAEITYKFTYLDRDYALTKAYFLNDDEYIFIRFCSEKVNADVSYDVSGYGNSVFFIFRSTSSDFADGTYTYNSTYIDSESFEIGEFVCYDLALDYNFDENNGTFRIQNINYFTDGSLTTIKHNGTNYEMTFNLTDKFGNKLTGSYNGNFFRYNK